MRSKKMNKKSYLLLVLSLIAVLSCNSEVTDQADALFRDGQYEQAIEAYNEYITTKPKDIKSIYNRGRAYEEIGQLSKAKEDFERVLDLDEENVNGNMSMGKYWYNRQDFNKAVYYFDKVLEVDGRVSSAYLFKARSLHQQGEFDEAMKFYDQAINFDGKNGDAFLYRGALKINLNQKRSACNDFIRAKALGADANDALQKYCQ